MLTSDNVGGYADYDAVSFIINIQSGYRPHPGDYLKLNWELRDHREFVY